MRKTETWRTQRTGKMEIWDKGIRRKKWGEYVIRAKEVSSYEGSEEQVILKYFGVK